MTKMSKPPKKATVRNTPIVKMSIKPKEQPNRMWNNHHKYSTETPKQREQHRLRNAKVKDRKARQYVIIKKPLKEEWRDRPNAGYTPEERAFQDVLLEQVLPETLPLQVRLNIANIISTRVSSRERELLSLALNMLYERWDKIEEGDPDKSMAKWRGYKAIRNTNADIINKLAKSREFDLLNPKP